MKILHVTSSYYPDARGDAEEYVDNLCQCLAVLGIENVVASPGCDTVNYVHHGVTVHRFAKSPETSNQMTDAEGDPVAAEAFAQILELEMPSVVHFHTRSGFVNVRCLRKVRRHGIPAISTLHDPRDFCARGTLLRWGTAPCDGRMRPKTCAACVLNKKMTPKPIAVAIATASCLTSPLARLPGLASDLRRLLRIEPHMAQLKKATEEWLENLSCIVVLNNWSQHPLRLNGVGLKRIRQVRHGLVHYSGEPTTKAVTTSLPLRLAIVGPFDRTSGFDLIAKALRMAPLLPMTIDLLPSISETVDRAVQRMLDHALLDSRIMLRSAVHHELVYNALSDYHALIVPSQRMETGPYSVLGAFAAGIPVIGSDLGGISEWVKDDRNGLLINDFSSPESWRNVLQRLVAEPELLQRLRGGVRPPRTMVDVASKMREIYTFVITGDQHLPVGGIATGKSGIRHTNRPPYGSSIRGNVQQLPT